MREKMICVYCKTKTVLNILKVYVKSERGDATQWAIVTVLCAIFALGMWALIKGPLNGVVSKIVNLLNSAGGETF